MFKIKNGKLLVSEIEGQGAGTVQQEQLADTSLELWDNPAKLTNYTDGEFGDGTGSILAREGVVVHSGAYAAKFTVNGDGNTFRFIVASKTGVTAGTIAAIKFWARKITAGGGHIAVVAYNESAEIATEVYDFVSTNTWIAYSEGQPPSYTPDLTEEYAEKITSIPFPASGKLYIYFVGVGGPNDVAYLDDISIKIPVLGDGDFDFSDGGVITKSVSGALSATPTKAELTALIGSPTDKAGWVIAVNDTSNNVTYFVTTDGTDWFYCSSVKAL